MLIWCYKILLIKKGVMNFSKISVTLCYLAIARLTIFHIESSFLIKGSIYYFLGFTHHFYNK